jgi:hypothetical protein
MCNQIDVLNNKSFTVYLGYSKETNKLVYIGTTIQKPKDRFRWHKYNKKDLKFEVFKQVDSAEEMLNLEFELIKKHNPSLNIIKERPQNLNKKLKTSELELRIGNKEWCQSCLKRRVNRGYIKCRFC